MPYRAKTMYSDETTAATYDAARFTSLRGRMKDRLEKALVLRALSTLPPGARVLDIPVGTGRMVPVLKSRGYDVVGADVSPTMLQHARDRSNGSPLLLADAEQMPFATGAFDGVLAVRLMFHVPSPIRVKILTEFNRVSRGLVVASYANTWTAASVIRRLRAGRGPRYIYPASQSEIFDEAAQSGLRVVGSWPMLPLCASTHFFAFRSAG